MFLSLLLMGMLLMFFSLWGDYMKLLIILEIMSVIFIIVVVMGVQMAFFSLNYFFACMIFLVCESSVGFLLFIIYISMESEVVKKMNLVQF